MTALPAIPPLDAPGDLRRTLRETAYPRPTFGAAPGYLQCNLLILPHGLAHDFSTFCAANPQACPLIYQTAPGQWDIPELGEDIDLRTDLGSYRVFRDGQAVSDLLDLHGQWQGDFVTFVMGSSYGLEAVLAGAGIETPYLARGEAPAHFITGRESTSSGTFRGPLAVTMRTLTADGVAAVEALGDAYPHLHGAPLAIGDPDALGIESLEAPVGDEGPTVTVGDGEVPVFWASALTAQLALSAARLPFCIANTPGHLLVTDIETEALRQDGGATADADADQPATTALGDDAPIPDVVPEADDAPAGDTAYALAIRPAAARAGDDGNPDDEAPDDATADEQAPLEAAPTDDAAGELAGDGHARADDADGTAERRADADGDPDRAAGETDADGAEDGLDLFADEPHADAEPEADDEPAGADDVVGDGLAAAGDDAAPDAEGDRAEDDPVEDGEDEAAAPPDGDAEPLAATAPAGADTPDLAAAAADEHHRSLEEDRRRWQQPPLSAGRMMRQRLAAASAENNGGKRESLFW